MATLASLRESLEDGVNIIHVACHGETEQYLKSKMGEVQYAAYPNKGDYLIFEDQIGCSKHLNVSDLAGLLGSIDVSNNPKCILLTSCQSLDQGAVFAYAGV